MNNNGKAGKTAKKPKSPKNLTKKAYILWGILATCVLTVLVVVTTVLVSAIVYVKGDLVVNLDEYKANQNQTSFVYAYDKSGATVELARLHGEEDRVWVDLDDMSPYLKEAFIALEDARFMKHHGVDWIRTFGVIVKPKNIGQGGSTITQQLIKNITNNKEVTIVRKYREILMALNLEENYDKDVILEAYLNTLYLGSGCYGVKTASEKYFGKDVSELDAAECACLAVITKAPTKYNPLLNPEENLKRRNHCLKLMYDEGKGCLNEEEYNAATTENLIFTNSPDYVPSDKIKDTKTANEDEKVINSFYVDYVIQAVRDDLMEKYGYSKQQATNQIYYGGLKIYTAVDLDVQATLEDVYVNRKSFPDMVSKKHGSKVQSAMTIMDYQGRIVAMVGQAGAKTQNRGLNRAANSYRQPGSTIKPLATGALTNGTTTVEMAAAYATFGNGGLYYKPYAYYKVTNSSGSEIVLSNENPVSQRAISEETSDIMCELLQTVDTSYYGTASNVRKFQIMAKTGTTSSDKDRWFCAGTPYYVAAVWVGFDSPETLNASVNPGGKIFFRVFDDIHKGLDAKQFPKSSGTVEKSFCSRTGKLASSNCGSTQKGWYKITSLPAVCTSCSGSSSSSSVLEAASSAVNDIANNINDVINDLIGER